MKTVKIKEDEVTHWIRRRIRNDQVARFYTVEHKNSIGTLLYSALFELNFFLRLQINNSRLMCCAVLLICRLILNGRSSTMYTGECVWVYQCKNMLQMAVKMQKQKPLQVRLANTQTHTHTQAVHWLACPLCYLTWSIYLFISRQICTVQV